MWASQTSSSELDYVVAVVSGEAVKGKHTFLLSYSKTCQSVESYMDRPQLLIRSSFPFVCTWTLLARHDSEKSMSSFSDVTKTPKKDNSPLPAFPICDGLSSLGLNLSCILYVLCFAIGFLIQS